MHDASGTTQHPLHTMHDKAPEHTKPAAKFQRLFDRTHMVHGC